MSSTKGKPDPKAALETPTDLSADATRDISGALNALLADVFVLYMKTKNFHWHMSGPHFRDYHLLLDEQGEQIFDMTTSHACSAFRTTMPILSRRKTCWPSCAKTTNGWRWKCAKRMQRARSTMMWRPRACWKTGSTKQSGGYGFCSRPAAATGRATDAPAIISHRKGGKPESVAPVSLLTPGRRTHAALCPSLGQIDTSN
jgi:hypothetical protein